MIGRYFKEGRIRMGDIINGVVSEYEMPKQPMFFEDECWKTGVLKPVTPQIKVVEESDKDKFESRVNEMLNNGYRILSTNCGFANSEQYDFCSSYQAILIFR
jgi:hypothetical protein